MKFMWFIAPATTLSSFESTWESAPDRWQPPGDVIRWVRSLAAQGNTDFFGARSAFAAIEELWIASDDPAVSSRARSEIERGLGGALGGIVDSASSLLMLVEDRVAIEGPECIGSGGIRQFAMARRKSGLTHEAFVDHWRNIHAPIVRNNPTLSRYVQNRVVRVEGDEPFFDGMSELSFIDADAARQFCNSTSYLEVEIKLDAPKFVDISTVTATLVDRQKEVPLKRLT
jgi:uncharacterized protein (TIGR02118 family)